MKKIEAQPPVAERIPHDVTRHGRLYSDPYYWLRDRSDEAAAARVMGYLEQENAYTEKMTEGDAKLRQALYDEMLARIKEDDSSVPVRQGQYFYYSRTEKGKQYRIHCRKRGSLEADEEILLDVNELAVGKSFLRLGAYEVSPDHRRLAFSVDCDGGERYTLRVKDLASGELLADQITDTYVSVEWAGDNETLFYTTVDETHRPYRLWRHRLGQEGTSDTCVYEESDDAFFLGLYKTKSRRYLMLHLGSNTTTECRFLDADDPTGEFVTVHPRQHEMEYSVEHWQELFFILCNDDAINFKLMQAPVATPGKSHWAEVLPHRGSIRLESFEVFADHLVVKQREHGLQALRVFGLPEYAEHEIRFEESVYALHFGANPEFDSSVLRFGYESLVTPPSVYDYEMNQRERELKKQVEVLGGFDPEAYTAERIFAKAPDGVEVPISLVRRKDAVSAEPAPLLLYGYGSYGATTDPTFSSIRFSLLDRGCTFAIAHIRGSGDLGRPWYEDGKLLRKRNTFTDFIACAEHLIAQRHTVAERLAIYGGSAGGLLMGAVTNMRPDLFGAVVAKVPFVDVVNTMLDETIPLTVIEWEEWGNPNEREYHDYMASYCPYDNVAAKVYPPMLVTTGLNDPRVAYWEPAKWVARLRARKTDSNLLLLKTDLGAGHGGASGRYDKLHEFAFDYAFVLRQLGVERGRR